MERSYWQNLLEKEEKEKGYNDGFKLLFCPWKLIEAADTLFLSLNPGNDPSGECMRIASDDRGNSYLVEREAEHAPIADQYRKFCEFVGKDPDEVLTGTLMPFRTTIWDKKRDRPNIEVTRPFWRHVLEQGKVRQVFCIGREVENDVIKMTDAILKLKISAGWGKSNIQRYETASGLQIFGLLHLSRFKMFSRPECKQQVEKLLNLGRVKY